MLIFKHLIVHSILKIVLYFCDGSCTWGKEDEAVTRFLPKQQIFIIIRDLYRSEFMQPQDQAYVGLSSKSVHHNSNR